VALVAGTVLLGASPLAQAQGHQKPKAVIDDWVWQHTENPYGPGDTDALAEGRRLYRATCYICHADTGSRGPNLRASKLDGQAFLKVVIHGRKGTQMPAWKGKLTEDEMWKILAFVKAPVGEP
jgi:mono/diheme cytochrome c family protein